MEKDALSIIHPLLEELTKDPSPARVDQIAQELEPYQDEAVPLLKKMLGKRRGYVGSNAFKVLALLGDPRAILAMLRFVDKEPGWVQHLSEVLAETLRKKDEETRKKINAQLVAYLIKGPKPPAPETFSPEKSERTFHKYINALKKATGVKELDEEATQIVADLKERWMRPPDQDYVEGIEKERIANVQTVLIEVINLLQAFEGLKDPRLKLVLEGYIKSGAFDSFFVQHMLTTLTRIDPALADSHLQGFIPSQGQALPPTTRVVHPRMDTGREAVDFSICVREDPGSDASDRPYSFRFENGLLFFLARGQEHYKWFAGRAQNREAAVEAAHTYLERWIPEIESMNAEKILIKPHSGAYTGYTRYAYLAELLEKHFDLERRGFRESYISPQHCPTIIYDSEWCRIKFQMYIDGNHAHDQRDHLAVHYGRLHAPNTAQWMSWNGETCWSWHWHHYFLPFLDGTPPREAAERFSPSPSVERYTQSEVAKQAAEAIDWDIGIQVAIWEYYGQRLFELFDLRRPDLWEAYLRYRREYEKTRNSSGYGTPPHDKVC